MNQNDLLFEDVSLEEISLVDSVAISEELEQFVKDTKNNRKSAFHRFLDEVSSLGLLTQEEETELFMQLNKCKKESDEWYEIRNEIVMHNYLLCPFVAKDYLNHGVELEDLVSAGGEGLIIAANKFDINRGVKFSTFAYWYVRNRVGRLIANYGRIVRLPVHVCEKIRTITKVKAELIGKLGYEPTIADIAATISDPEFTEEKIKKIFLIIHDNNLVSLDKMVSNGEDDTELSAYVEDANTPSAHEAYAQSKKREVMEQALATLKPLKRRVMELKYSFLNGDRDRTLEEVADALYEEGTTPTRVSREYVRQIEAWVVKKFNESSEYEELRKYWKNN